MTTTELQAKIEALQASFDKTKVARAKCVSKVKSMHLKNN